MVREVERLGIGRHQRLPLVEIRGDDERPAVLLEKGDELLADAELGPAVAEPFLDSGKREEHPADVGEREGLPAASH